MQLHDVLEWTATALSLVGAVLVALPAVEQRRRGFLVWIVANAIWIAWGCLEQKWGVTTLFTAYQATSLLGWWNARPNGRRTPASPSAATP